MNIFKSPVSNSVDFLCQSGKYHSYIKIQFTLQIITDGKDYHYHVHFRDEDTKAQRGRGIELRIKLMGPDSRVDAQ